MLNGANGYNNLPTVNPFAPQAYNSTAATARMQGPGDPSTDGNATESAQAQMLGNQVTQVFGAIINLIGGLLQNLSRNGQAPPDGGGQALDGGGGGGGGAAPVGNTGSDTGGTAPVNGSNTSNMAGNSGNNVSANASGTAFPVVGYQGQVDLHHGSSHGGADLMAPRGTPVVAMRGGTVESVGSSGAGGNSVQIKGEDGLTYYYAHLDQAPSVSQGQKIQTGTQIGVVGDSGNAKGTGTHLHLGIGQGIQSGTGPNGGTGANFDATAYLQQSLAAQNGRG